VDGALKGSASPAEPLQIRDLPVGSVTVKVEAPGCQARETQAEIQEGQWALAKVVLAKLRAPAPARAGVGYLGIGTQNLDAELQASLGVQEGVLVADVVQASPAMKAGVQRLDVVTAVNGTPVRTAVEMVAAVGKGAPGTAADLTVWRDGGPRTIQAVLGERPAALTPAVDLERVYGFTVELPAGTATQVRAATQVAAAVTVKTVTPGTGAAAKGLETGVVILSVGSADVKDLAGFNQEVSKAAGKPLLLRVKRATTGAIAIIAVPPRG